MDIPSEELTRAEKKRAQIRRAAKELFLRSGFQGTSTDAIKAAAGVSKETLYRYYASKEDLFVDVMRSLTTERLNLPLWAEQSPEPTSLQDLRVRLQDIARQVIEMMLQPEYQAIARLMLAEMPRFPELGPLFRQAVPRPAIHALLLLLHQGQVHGVVRQAVDLPLISRMFFSTLLSYGILDGLLSPTQTSHIPEAGIIETFVDQIIELVSVKHNG